MSDIINKTFHNCGCILVSKLDFIENQINDIYIQICPKHFNSKTHQIKNYTWNKKYNKHILKSQPSENNLQPVNKLKKQKSFDNLTNINNRLNDNTKLPDLNILTFGKYKNYTYSYVYSNDKLYCYNLAFWNKKMYKNKAINDFINYINNHINLNQSLS
jgi:hypothetical protein